MADQSGLEKLGEAICLLHSAIRIFWPLALRALIRLRYCAFTLLWQDATEASRLGSSVDRITVVPGILLKIVSSMVFIRAPILGMSTFLVQSLVPALISTTFGRRYKDFPRTSAPPIWDTTSPGTASTLCGGH